jgi:hypothetical protein
LAPLQILADQGFDGKAGLIVYAFYYKEEKNERLASKRTKKG